MEDPHVRYSIDKTAAVLVAHGQQQLNSVRDLVRGNRWFSDPTPGRLDFSKVNQIGIVYSPAYLEPAYDNHIECRERIQAILHRLATVGEEHFNWIEPAQVAEEKLSWVHGEQVDRHRDRSWWPGYLEDVKRANRSISQKGIEPSQSGPSELRFESYDIALLSVGGVIQAVDYVLNGPAPAAFAINRPPGHLANNAICIFNNIAIAARHAQRQYGLRRIAIVDCDAHQGKHTNQAFIRDPNVIYFSMHIEGDYAREDGRVYHTGLDQGKGYNFNLPYPKNMPDAGYQYLVDALLEPVLREFKPELIMISAGFDGHFDDTLTPPCILSEHAYIYLAERLRAVADDLDIKVVGCLEGGYGLDALARSMVHMLRVFGRWPVTPEIIGFTPFPTPYEPAPEAVAGVQKLVQERVHLMAAQKEADSTYLFDLAQPHWQAILDPEAE
jgi:acetoin utilization deacetylase AcuC-like enzyme